ncbi:DUF4157 domain-containing protein [Aliiroseovarius sp. YM-037]|uniref:eCIS core domain-containing protein n=1 Tax=Aliiroseovarius sp. YM-037 TaxID=3341728 RepID=UPI003A7FD937
MSCTALTCQRSRAAPRIASPESDTEREATKIADEVISGSPVTAPSASGGSGVIHRECAACASGGPKCADCAEDDVLHRDHTGPSPTSGAAAQTAASALSGGGTPMPQTMRSYFEPRFGADLSGVRLHTSGQAATAARGINARAYAMGQNIGFAPGAYAPETGKGRKLLAHEITHTLQGDGQLHRQEDDEEEEAAPTPSPPSARVDTFEDDSGGGETTFEERVENAPTVVGDHIQGTVRRLEHAPANGDTPAETFPAHTAFVDFDGGNCKIILPYRFAFELAENDPRGTNCQGDPVDQGGIDLNEIGQQYVDAINAEMNDQFKIRLSGCEHDCADQDIPIEVRASVAENDDVPDRTITVVSRGGRGNSRTLCAGDFDLGFPVHEAGHQILGRGDEYREDSASTIARKPHTGRNERVRDNYGWLGERHNFGRFAVFHERDFRHVQTFMRAAMPDCDAELVGVPQINISVRIFGVGGLGTIGGSYGVQGGGGIDLGIPLTRGREWLLLVGAQADYLRQLEGDEREFVLAGMRLGLEYSLQGTDVSGRFFGGTRFGVSRELESQRVTFGDEPAPTFGPRTSAFGEGEIGAGILVPGGGSGAFTADLRLRGGGEISTNPDAIRWINVGVSLGARF